MLILLALAAVWLAVDLYYSNQVPQLTRTEVPLATLPAGFDGFRVAHLSDWHRKDFGTDGNTIFDLLKQEQPDIIVLTGDFIDRTEHLDWAEDTLLRLKEIAPTYFVTGNHEWGEDWRAAKLNTEPLTPHLRDVMDKLGVVWLDHSHRVLERGGSSLVIAGFTDPNGPAYQLDYAAQVQAIRDELDDPFILLLCHRYDMLETYTDLKISLTLAGHAHGGVVRLPFTDGLIGPGHDFLPKHTSGLTVSGDSVLAVSRGLGPTAVPRLFNRPQVSLLTLRCGE